MFFFLGHCLVAVHDTVLLVFQCLLLMLFLPSVTCLLQVIYTTFVSTVSYSHFEVYISVNYSHRLLYLILNSVTLF